MADKKPPRTPLMLSPEALFRYQIVSAVTGPPQWGARPRGSFARYRVLRRCHTLLVSSRSRLTPANRRAPSQLFHCLGACNGTGVKGLFAGVTAGTAVAM
jgi:hypothetical protein